MNHPHQIIYDANNQPIFALIPHPEYEKIMSMLAQQLDHKNPLLSEDGLSVRLPHGGPGAAIDLITLANYCYDSSLESIGICARQQRLSKFDRSQAGALDPLIRMCFLAQGSPYRNAMQATDEVVEALVQTGLFTRTKRDFNDPEKGQRFYRPVKALNINYEAVKSFVKSNSAPRKRIPLLYWCNTEYNAGLFDSRP